MKKVSYLLLSLLILPCLILFSGCGETEEPPVLTALNENMITIDYTSTIYNGEEKKPAVTVKIEDVVVEDTNYTVEYKNNINVGTAKVVVTAKEDSQIIKGSAIRTFSITRISKTVSNYAELVQTLQDPNYINIYCNGNINIPANETLTINEGVTLNIGQFNVDNNGTIVNNGNLVLNYKPTGVGTLTNNGFISANVTTRQGILDAIGYADKIILADTITGGVNVLDRIEFNGNNGPVNVTLDLNGHNLETNIAVRGHQTNKVVVRITNGSTATTSTIGTINHNYGLIVLGNGSYKNGGGAELSVTLNNLNFVGLDGGVATNGQYKGGRINATNCTFEGKNYLDEDLTETCVGAYLPAQYAYEFKKCTFIGFTAYYAKSGEPHSLSSCTFEAKGAAYHDPSKYGDGCKPTGSAIVIDSSTNYQSPLKVFIAGNTVIKSTSGYGIEEFATFSEGETKVVYSEVTIMGTVKFETAKDDYIERNIEFDVEDLEENED